MKTKENWPKISIITPVKNAVHTLEKAIKSLIDQNYPNLEYIIMDGGSTDGTLEIIKKYKKYISYWQSLEDENGIEAQNNGIKKASGEIVSFLNADDFYESKTLEKIAKTFNEDKTLDIVSTCCKAIKFNASKNDYEIIENYNSNNMRLDKNRIIQSYNPNSRFFKRELFFKYGFPIIKDDEGGVFYSNDQEYLIRFLFKGIKSKVISYIGYNYLIHEGSFTFSNNKSIEQRLYKDKIYISKIFLNSNEINVPDIWGKTFKKWIKKYRAILVKNYLERREWKNFKANFILGIQDNGLFNFGFYFIKTIIRQTKRREW